MRSPRAIHCLQSRPAADVTLHLTHDEHLALRLMLAGEKAKQRMFRFTVARVYLKFQTSYEHAESVVESVYDKVTRPQ